MTCTMTCLSSVVATLTLSTLSTLSDRLKKRRRTSLEKTRTGLCACSKVLCMLARERARARERGREGEREREGEGGGEGDDDDGIILHSREYAVHIAATCSARVCIIWSWWWWQWSWCCTCVRGCACMRMDDMFSACAVLVQWADISCAYPLTSKYMCRLSVTFACVSPLRSGQA